MCSFQQRDTKDNRKNDEGMVKEGWKRESETGKTEFEVEMKVAVRSNAREDRMMNGKFKRQGATWLLDFSSCHTPWRIVLVARLPLKEPLVWSKLKRSNGHG